MVQGRLKDGLTALGFDYEMPRTRLRAGNAVPGLGAVSGLALFLTECGPCTRKTTEVGLVRAGVRPESLLFVTADGSNRWQAPRGYEATRRIVAPASWQAVGILPYGPPCLVRLERGEVREVLF